MIIVRQSTARTVMIGPILDANGVAVTDRVVGNLKLSKNGAAPAALNGSATLTHRNTGHYSLTLTTSDLDTVGQTEVVIDDTTNACPIKELTVIEEAVYDALFASGATGALPVSTGGIAADSFAVGAIDSSALASNVINDIWQGTSLTESYAADGAAFTPAQALYEICQALTEFAISGTTITVKKRDGSTTALTYTIDSASTPTSRTRAS